MKGKERDGIGFLDGLGLGSWLLIVTAGLDSIARREDCPSRVDAFLGDVAD